MSVNAPHPAEQAAVQHALSHGWLQLRQLREALLLQGQLQAAGQPTPLLALLRARYLQPGHVDALKAVYHRAASEMHDPAGQELTLPPPAAAVLPDCLLRSGEQLRQPPERDPAAVRRFLEVCSASTVKDLPAPAETRPPATPTAKELAAARADCERAYRNASQLDPHFAPHANDVLKRLETLGEGGMGVVYRVLDARLGREAALKLIRGEYAADDDVLRFRREAEITARLDHPSIPPVYEAGTNTAGEHYMLMRVIEGDPLSDRLKQVHGDAGATLSGPQERALLEALVKVGEAVAYAHTQGVIHRDLKPANVMLGEFGEVMVVDWGLARDTSLGAEAEALLRRGLESSPSQAEVSQLTQAGVVLGTPGYMPREQAQGLAVDARTDVFSLGAILSCVLTGRPPIEGTTPLNRIFATLEGRITLPRERRQTVPPELNSIAARALAAAPEDRYPSAGAFVSDLQAYLTGGAVSVHPYGVRERVQRAAARHSTLLALLALGAVALGLLGGVVTHVRAQSDARLAKAEAQNTQRAIEAERNEQAARVDAARDYARAKLVALEQLGNLTPGERVARGVDALEATERWSTVAAADGAARQAWYTAAVKLVALARESEQLSLARKVLARAEQRHPNDDALREQRRELDEAARRQREHVEALLEHAERGRFSERPGQLSEAVFKLQRWASQETVALLCARLDALSTRLEQRDALSAGQRDVAKLACEALGRIGISAGAEQTLTRHLAAQRTEQRAVPAGVALARLKTPSANAAVHAARRRWGANGSFARQVERHLSAQGSAEPTGNVASYLRRAGQRRAEGDLKGALADLSRALELNPKLAGAWGNRGLVRQALGDLNGALADLSRTLELRPRLAKAWANRGLVRGAMGDRRGALADLSRALELDPRDTMALVNRGSVRQLQGDLKGALADLSRALELNPKLFGAWLNLGAVRHALGDLKGALTDLSRAIQLDPQDALPWFNRGLVRQALGDLKGTLADYSRAIELDPKFIQAWVNRGMTRHALGDLKGALVDHSNALALDPKLARVWTNRGDVRGALGDPKGALLDHSRAIELDPKLAVPWTNRGSARWALGDFKGALADHSHAIELDPTLAVAWTNRGMARRALGDPRGALADHSRAIELDPKLANARGNRALVRQALGDVKGALTDLSSAIQLNPKHAKFWCSRGGVRRSLGDSNGSVADCSRAIELDAKLALAWLHRGAAQSQLGRTREAVRDLSWFLELAPDHPRAPKVRALLKRLRTNPGER